MGHERRSRTFQIRPLGIHERPVAARTANDDATPSRASDESEDSRGQKTKSLLGERVDGLEAVALDCRVQILCSRIPDGTDETKSNIGAQISYDGRHPSQPPSLPQREPQRGRPSG